MEIASLIVAILALLGSFVGYLLHDRKLKKQEAHLNSLQTAELETSASDRKRARLVMQTYYHEKGRGVLQVKNDGLADARNIKWHLSNDALQNVAVDGDYDLLIPGQELGLRYIYLDRRTTDDTVTAEISWEDDFRKDNKLSIQLFCLNKPCK